MLLPTDTNLEERVLARTRQATALYERHAYLVHNLALRIACERAAAQRAAERTFLALAAEAEPDTEVVAVAVRVAIAEAPDRPRPESSGDEDADRLLDATGRLAAPQRAALAVAGLCGLDEHGVAGAMELDAPGATTLLEAALAAFAARVGLGAEEAAEAYAAWPWSPPPEELWQSLWPQLHAAAATPDAEAPAGADASAQETTVMAAPKRQRARRRPRLRLPRAPRRRTVVLLALLAAGGAAYASGVPAGLGGEEERRSSAGSPAAPQAPSTALPAADPSDEDARPEDVGPNPDVGADVRRSEPLSPAELDKLRTRELEALKRLQRQEADDSLPKAERADASRRIARIEKLARQRIAAAERRERALRRELSRERALRAREQEDRLRERAADRARARRDEARRERGDRAATPAPAPAEPEQPAELEGDQGCTFNEADGTYTCPVE